MESRNRIKWKVVVAFVVATICSLLVAASPATRPGLRKRTQLTLQFNELTHCSDVMSNSLIVKQPLDFRYGAINGFFEITSHAAIIGKVNIIMSRCRQGCEHFLSWRFQGNNCHILVMKKALWYPLVHSSKPYNLTCPMRKASYEIINGTLDSHLINNLSIDSTDWDYWKIRVELWDISREPMFLCFNLGLKGIRKIVHHS